MATKKKTVRRKRQPRKKQPDRAFKVLLASLFLVGFLVISLVLLTFVQRPSQRNRVPVVSQPVVEQPSGVADTQDRVLRTSVQIEIERALWRQGISFTGVDVVTDDHVMHYHLPSLFPGKAWYDGLIQALEKQSSQLDFAFVDGATPLVHISVHGTPSFALHFKRARSKPAKVRPKARIAIVVDDLGRDLHMLRRLLAIDLDLTMAVMPEEPHTRQSAEMAHRAGREVLVHMPMEPESYPRNNPGPGALLLGQDRLEIERRVTRMFEKVPHAVGGNNHMGSRFTQYAEGLQAVFEVMKKNGLFFVDSRTSPGSVAFIEARRAKIPAVSRDIFLDNRQDVDAIARQLREAVKMARSRGKVVAICHPYAQTVEALQQEADFLRQQDVEVIPVSHLLRR